MYSFCKPGIFLAITIELTNEKNIRKKKKKKKMSPVPAFVTKDVLQTFMYSFCKPGIFLAITIELTNEKNILLLQNTRTLYKDPSVPTAQPSSKYPILLTIAAIPQALKRAARFPMSLASARKN